MQRCNQLQQHAICIDIAFEFQANIDITASRVSKAFHDQHVDTVDYKVGDLVQAYNYNTTLEPGRKRKLEWKWRGPYRIIKKLGEATFEIEWADMVPLEASLNDSTAYCGPTLEICRRRFGNPSVFFA